MPGTWTASSEQRLQNHGSGGVPVDGKPMPIEDAEAFMGAWLAVHAMMISVGVLVMSAAISLSRRIGSLLMRSYRPSSVVSVSEAADEVPTTPATWGWAGKGHPQWMPRRAWSSRGGGQHAPLSTDEGMPGRWSTRSLTPVQTPISTTSARIKAATPRSMIHVVSAQRLWEAMQCCKQVRTERRLVGMILLRTCKARNVLMLHVMC
mmetsp:Transcript_44028/g.115683  ORF Transcript_44028/g.115683 Transcript_44028/m.115683 type:complete len:206 (+) Transcript_44028:378-995(+)